MNIFIFINLIMNNVIALAFPVWQLLFLLFLRSYESYCPNTSMCIILHCLYNGQNINQIKLFLIFYKINTYYSAHCWIAWISLFFAILTLFYETISQFELAKRSIWLCQATIYGSYFIFFYMSISVSIAPKVYWQRITLLCL
jgi:hypothetical protein